MFHVSAVAGFLTQQGTKISVVFLLVLAEQSQGIQQLLGMKMVADNLAIIRQIHHIERMK